MSIGIYKITNIINNKSYIGQSIDLNRRLKEHKRELNKNNHKNVHLQNAYNKYGKENFKFEILGEYPITDLDNIEKKLIKQYKTDNRQYGYNIEKGGNLNKFIPLETRKKMSVNHANVKKEKHPRWKNTPSIVKHSVTKNGNQLYGILFHKKWYKFSINKNYLEYYLEKHYAEIIRGVEIKKEPKITKVGFTNYGKQKYRLVYDGKIIKQSIYKEKLEKFLQDNYEDIVKIKE